MKEIEVYKDIYAQGGYILKRIKWVPIFIIKNKNENEIKK